MGFLLKRLALAALLVLPAFPASASASGSCSAHGVATPEIQAERSHCQNLIREGQQAKQKLEELREKARPENARAAMQIPSGNASRDLILRLKQQLTQLETTHTAYVNQAKETLRELVQARNQSNEAQQRLGQFVSRQQTELQRKNQERNGFMATGRVLQSEGEELRRRVESMPNTQAYQQSREAARARFQDVNRRIEQNNDRMERVAQEISELETRIREGNAAVREQTAGRDATNDTRSGLERVVRENEKFVQEARTMNARLNPDQVGSLADVRADQQDRADGEKNRRSEDSNRGTEAERATICSSLRGSSDTAALAREGCVAGATQRDVVARRAGESNEELIRRQAIVSRTGGLAELEASTDRLGGPDGVRRTYEERVRELGRVQRELEALPRGTSPDFQSPEYQRHRALVEEYNKRYRDIVAEPALGLIASENNLRPIQPERDFQDFQTARRNSVSAAEFGTVTDYQSDFGLKLEGREYRVPTTDEVRGRIGAEASRVSGANNVDAVRVAIVEANRLNPATADPMAGAFALTPTSAEIEASDMADTVRHRPTAAGRVVGGTEDPVAQQKVAAPVAQAIQRVETQDTAEMVTGVLPAVGTIQEYIGADRDQSVARDSQAQLGYSSLVATEALERGKEREQGAHFSAAVDVATTATGMKVIGGAFTRASEGFERGAAALRGFFGAHGDSAPQIVDRGVELIQRGGRLPEVPIPANDNLVRNVIQGEPVAGHSGVANRYLDQADQPGIGGRIAANDNEAPLLTQVRERPPEAAVESVVRPQAADAPLASPKLAEGVRPVPEVGLVRGTETPPVRNPEVPHRGNSPTQTAPRTDLEQASKPTQIVAERRSVFDRVLGGSEGPSSNSPPPNLMNNARGTPPPRISSLEGPPSRPNWWETLTNPQRTPSPERPRTAAFEQSPDRVATRVRNGEPTPVSPRSQPLVSETNVAQSRLGNGSGLSPLNPSRAEAAAIRDLDETLLAPKRRIGNQYFELQPGQRAGKNADVSDGFELANDLGVKVVAPTRSIRLPTTEFRNLPDGTRALVLGDDAIQAGRRASTIIVDRLGEAQRLKRIDESLERGGDAFASQVANRKYATSFQRNPEITDQYHAVFKRSRNEIQVGENFADRTWSMAPPAKANINHEVSHAQTQAKALKGDRGAQGRSVVYVAEESTFSVPAYDRVFLVDESRAMRISSSTHASQAERLLARKNLSYSDGRVVADHLEKSRVYLDQSRGIVADGTRNGERTLEVLAQADEGEMKLVNATLRNGDRDVPVQKLIVSSGTPERPFKAEIALPSGRNYELAQAQKEATEILQRSLADLRQDGARLDRMEAKITQVEDRARRQGVEVIDSRAKAGPVEATANSRLAGGEAGTVDGVATRLASRTVEPVRPPEVPSWGLADRFKKWIGVGPETTTAQVRAPASVSRAPASVTDGQRLHRRLEAAADTVKMIEDRYAPRYWQPDPKRSGRLIKADLDAAAVRELNENARNAHQQNLRLSKKIESVHEAIGREMDSARSRGAPITKAQARDKVLAQNQDEILELSRKYVEESARGFRSLGFEGVRPVLREAEFTKDSLLHNPKRWVLEASGEGATVPDPALTGYLRATNGRYGVVIDPVSVDLLKAGGYFQANSSVLANGGNVYLRELPLFSSRVSRDNTILHEIEHAIKDFKARDPGYRTGILERIREGGSGHEMAVEYAASGRADSVVEKFARARGIGIDEARVALDDLVVRREAADFLLTAGTVERGKEGFQTWERYESVERLSRLLEISSEQAFLKIERAAKGLEREIGAGRAAAGKDSFYAVANDARLSKNDLYAGYLSGDELSTYRKDILRESRLGQQGNLAREAREYVQMNNPSALGGQGNIGALGSRSEHNANFKAKILSEFVDISAPRYEWAAKQVDALEDMVARGESPRFRVLEHGAGDGSYTTRYYQPDGEHLFDVARKADGTASVILPTSENGILFENLVLRVDGSGIGPVRMSDWARSEGLGRIREGLQVAEERTLQAARTLKRMEEGSLPSQQKALDSLFNKADERLEQESRIASARSNASPSRDPSPNVGGQMNTEALVSAHYKDRVNMNTGRPYSSESLSFAARLEEVAPTELTANRMGKSSRSEDASYQMTQRRNVSLGTSPPRAQGWVIQVAPKPELAARLAKDILPELRARGVPHSVINDLDYYQMQSQGDRDFGKFIKVFPRNEDEARVVAKAIEERIASLGYSDEDFFRATDSRSLGRFSSARFGRISTYSNAEERSMLSRVDKSFVRNGDLASGYILDPKGRPVRELAENYKPDFVTDPFIEARPRRETDYVGNAGPEINSRFEKVLASAKSTTDVGRTSGRAPASVSVPLIEPSGAPTFRSPVEVQSLERAAQRLGLTRFESKKIELAAAEENRRNLTLSALTKIAKNRTLTREESDNLHKVLKDAGIKHSINSLGGGLSIDSSLE